MYIEKTKDEVVAFCNDLWKPASYDHFEVLVDHSTSDSAKFTVKQMYEYVELDFAKLKAVSDFFGTLDVVTDKDSYGGCETCDYGSSYEVTFKVRRDAT